MILSSTHKKSFIIQTRLMHSSLTIHYTISKNNSVPKIFEDNATILGGILGLIDQKLHCEIL